MTRVVVALAFAALPVGLVACGDSNKGSSNSSGTTAAPNPGPAVRAAVKKTVAAGSEHAVVSAQVAAAGQQVAVSGHGDFDSKQRLGTLSATLSLGGIDTSVDEVLQQTTVYISSPLVAAVLPAGKKWLKVDLASAGKAFGVDTSILGAQDPASALAQLDAIENVHALGSQTIGGVQTTHYRGTVNAAKLPAGSGALLGQTGAKLGPYDVWVGDDGYVHRVKVTATASQAAKTTVTMTLSDFGEDVQVSVPPASETVDASKVSIPGIGG